MPITADATCEILVNEDKDIVASLSYAPHTPLLQHWKELPIRMGYIQVSALTRYHVSSAVRHRLASLDWMQTDNEQIRTLIRALRLIHGC